MAFYKGLNTHEIIEPGQSDKAAFDPDAYHRAMRDGRSEGVMHYVVVFLAGVMLGFSFSVTLPFQMRFLVGLVLGVVFMFGLRSHRAKKVRKLQAEAVTLHAQAHTLETTAVQSEIERAKASGAFDRWSKS